jgi:hypothetical protein
MVFFFKQHNELKIHGICNNIFFFNFQFPNLLHQWNISLVEKKVYGLADGLKLEA